RGLIFVLYASSMVWAQTATLSGTVTDEAGMPLAGVQITLRYLNSGNSWSEVTREEGKYRVTALPLGSYLLTASLAGFKSDVRGVPLRSRADEVVVDFTLEVEDSPGRVRREAPAEPPEVQSREPIDEPVPNAARTRASITPEAETSPPPIAQPAANQLDSTGTQPAGFAVQVGAFRSRPKAEELQVVLQHGGYPVIVVEADIPGSGRYYRVRVGPFVTEQEAREAASNLRSRFPQRIPAFWIVSPQP
ncbi:MAG: carboxypeptidase regulatory-like domain-containing protein, partial [Acidobacteria bacterium]|nr:carboxypeptidase regulatory-like domain-containing protein [Acidobacteriota bacterium]